MDDRLEDFLKAQAEALAAHGVVAESRTVPVRGPGGQNAAHVLVSGSGPPVLLLNGVGLPAAFWAPLLAELQGFRLHAVDLPGFGLSSPRGPWRDVAELRASVVELLGDVADGLGLTGPVAYVGNSLGSLWASWLALDEPSRVRALVHVACPALVLGTGAPLPMRLLSLRGLGDALMRLQPPSPKQVERLAAMVGEDLAAQPVVRDLLLAAERLPHHAPTLRSMLHVLLRLRGPRPEAALGPDDLSRIKQPVQLVWADADPFGSVAVGRAVCAALPDAELHVVPGGHAPWLHHGPAVAAPVNAFLGRHAA